MSSPSSPPFKAISVFILVILFLTYNPQFSFAEDSFNLSGKYKGYNVILIIFDALRPDHLSCYGYPKKTSPHIDALAKQGIIFKNTFSQAVLTLPCVTSLFTSLYPYLYGVIHVFKDTVPERVYTLAQILNIYGYKTVWYGKLQDPQSGAAPSLLKGFIEKYEISRYDDFTSLTDYGKRIFKWIRRHKERPFFITVHSYLTHEDYFPSNRFNNKFSQGIPKKFLGILDTFSEKFLQSLQDMLRDDPEKIYKILDKDWVEEHKGFIMQPFYQGKLDELYELAKTPQRRYTLQFLWIRPFLSLLKSLDEKQVSGLLSLLDSTIYEADKDMVGKLINELKESGLYEKTIIIITADHANEYREHGELGHGTFLYDESIHIPFILYLPHLPRAVVIKELAQQIDILPTLLDLLAIPVPYQAQGISLVGLAEGRKNALTNEYVFSQSMGIFLSIRSKDWKFIIQKSTAAGPPESGAGLNYTKSSIGKAENDIAGELFNLRKDKYEKNNLIKIKPEVARALKRQLDAKLDNLILYQTEISEFMPGLDEETKERIKKTGYW